MNFRAILPLSSARRRAMPGMPIAAGLIAACVATAPVAHGQDSTSESSDTEINYTFDGGINAVAEENLYWNLADRFAPSANFDSDTQWLEVYAKPGVEITHNADQALQFYGGFSVVASATLGTDAFDQKNTSRLTIEEAYVGFRTGTVETGQFDLSVGAQGTQAWHGHANLERCLQRFRTRRGQARPPQGLGADDHRSFPVSGPDGDRLLHRSQRTGIEQHQDP